MLSGETSRAQWKPKPRRKRKTISVSEGLLEMMGLEVMAESVRAGENNNRQSCRVVVMLLCYIVCCSFVDAAMRF